MQEGCQGGDEPLGAGLGKDDDSVPRREAHLAQTSAEPGGSLRELVIAHPAVLAQIVLRGGEVRSGQVRSGHTAVLDHIVLTEGRSGQVRSHSQRYSTISY